MKKSLVIFSLFLSSLTVSSQIDSLIDVSFGADFMSSYVWRGQKLSSSPAIQPSIELSFGNFTLGGWASWQLTDYWHETDIYFGYENDWLMAGVTDYFTIDDFYAVPFTNFTTGQSAHILEAYLGFPGSEKIPFQFSYYSTFFGDLDDNDEELYSGFIELAWLFSIKETDAMLRFGLTPGEGMYADNFAWVEAAFCVEKEIEITDGFSLNAQSQMVYNPYIKDIYLVFGLGCYF